MAVAVAEIPNEALTDDAPLYHREVGEWIAPVPKQKPGALQLGAKRNFNHEFHKLLASPNICSKHWVYEQYDSMVQTNTVQGPGSLAGVIRIKGTARGLAMALYGNGRWCYLDPKLGAEHNVARAARMVACTGAQPVAATNCLNFGNPEKPPIMAQFSAGDRRPFRSLHRPGHTDYGRQRELLQRDPGRRNLPDADPRHRGHSRRM